MQIKEFELGDKVTYAPYWYEYDMYVIGYQTSIDGETMLYKLSAKAQHLRHATAICSGRCIKESKFYKEYEGV